MNLEEIAQPEDLARSLMREFFLKLNYKKTLEAWEKEDNRPRVKITKIELIQLLSMERLVKNNKQKQQPYQTLIEILTDYLFSKYKGRGQNNQSDTVSIASKGDDSRYSGDTLSIGSQANIKPSSNLTSAQQNNGIQNSFSSEIDSQINFSSGNRTEQKQSFPDSKQTMNVSQESKPSISAQIGIPRPPVLQSSAQENKQKNDNEFQIGSRRGMKKVNRNNSKDQQTSDLPKQNTSNIKENDLSTSVFTANQNQNSEIFSNLKTDMQVSAFGSSNIQSKVSDEPFGDSKVQQSNLKKSKVEQPVTSVKPQEQQQQQQKPEVKQEQASNEAKNFNFFGKKKQVDSTKINNDFDDLDAILQVGSANEQQNQPKQTPIKKSIFDDDEDLNFSYQPAKKGDQNSSKPTKEITQSIIPLEDHVKINFFDKGKVNFKFNLPKINFLKVSGAQAFSKKNIGSIQGTELADIKALLFSQSQNKFLPKSWGSAFILNEGDNCFYGLKQKEGGPCGVIACVQAFFLKYLFFVYPETVKGELDLKSYKNKIVRENCLVAALAEILFNLRGEDDLIRIASIQNSASLINKNQAVPIEACGAITLKTNTLEQAFDLLHQYKEEFTNEHSQGVTTFLYSTILTKGTKAIKSEMDSEDGSLIGHHGHCSQEQVNLFLTGKARSNCFDGEKILDENYKLKGIDKRAQFGFLTIFEHLKYLEVGSALKTPLFPVWIICKEYHYSVIFSKDFRANECIEQPYFDLIFYDQLYNPDDQIKLTVTQKKYAKTPYSSNSEQHFLFARRNKGKGDEQEDEDMIPTIELVMRTKWGKEISVDWNGTQPIL